MILTLFSSRKKFNYSIVWDWATRTKVGSVSSSRINNCPASLRYGLDQVVTHMRWDDHPLQLEYLKQLMHIPRGVYSASSTSLQLVPSVFVWVKVWGQGKPGENFGRCCWRGTVWCCVLHGVWHCRVDVQCHSTFDARNKTAKTYAFLCLNTIVSSQDPPLCVHYNIKVAILCPHNYSVFALHKHRERETK